MTVVPFKAAAAETADDLPSNEIMGRYFIFRQTPEKAIRPEGYHASEEMNGEIVRANSGNLRDGLVSITQLNEYGEGQGTYYALLSDLKTLENEPVFANHESTAEVLTPDESAYFASLANNG